MPSSGTPARSPLSSTLPTHPIACASQSQALQCSNERKQCGSRPAYTLLSWIVETGAEMSEHEASRGGSVLPARIAIFHRASFASCIFSLLAAAVMHAVSGVYLVSNCSTCMIRFFGLGLQRRARHKNACLLCQDDSFLCLQQSCTVADVHGSLSGRMSLKATLHVGWYCVPRAPGPVVSAERRAVGSCVRYACGQCRST